MPARIDLTGKRVGRWTVLRFGSSHGPGRARPFWLCRCDCGVEREVAAGNLRTGASASCGCLQRETTQARATKHTHARDGKKSPEYLIWVEMRGRCTNPRNPRYADYGGRGIRVSARWKSFDAFLADMGPRPSGMSSRGRSLYSIDRIDNDRGYEPGNCRWATWKEQANNRRPARRRSRVHV